MSDEHAARTGITHIPEITSEMENWRDVPLFPDGSRPDMRTSRRDPVKPVPEGTYVAMVFRVDGYDPDVDGSLMARLSQVYYDEDDGWRDTGWEPNAIGLRPHSDWVLDDPGVLDRLAGPADRTPTPAPEIAAEQDRRRRGLGLSR